MAAASTSSPRDALIQHVREQLDLRPPLGAYEVHDSVPVLAFGDALRARVATIGINPSKAEFAAPDPPIPETRSSLGLRPGVPATIAQADALLDACSAYFHRKPYWTWFAKLEGVLRAGVGASYKSGTACHLDLVPWATDPVWGKIKDEATRADLLHAGAPVLEAVLDTLDLDLVLLNGQQVLTQLQQVGLLTITSSEMTQLPPDGKAVTLVVGEVRGIRALGWSVNLQSSWGVSKAFLAGLASWVTTQAQNGAERAAPAPVPVPVPVLRVPSSPTSSTVDEHGLLAQLQRWASTSTSPTLADVGSFGGAAAIHAVIGGVPVHLNADTTRAAILEFLTEAAAGTLVWLVLSNSKGTVNKVVFRGDGKPTKGWYCYTDAPLPAPTAL